MNARLWCFSHARAVFSAKISWYSEWLVIPGMSYLISMSLSVLICKIFRLIPNGILVHTCNTEDGAWSLAHDGSFRGTCEFSCIPSLWVVQGRRLLPKSLCLKSVLISVWVREARSMSVIGFIPHWSKQLSRKRRGSIYTSKTSFFGFCGVVVVSVFCWWWWRWSFHIKYIDTFRISTG